jgi:pimeloyl-ACP methyl ester carboxylesterase
MGIRRPRIVLGLIVGAVVGYTAAQQMWALHTLARINPMRTLRIASTDGPSATPTVHFRDAKTSTYTRTHSIEDGIERITYRPHKPVFETPLLFQHGMWHGAWCWELWQGVLAALGWESHAFSLPGHGQSPERRPVARCTLDYYLRFLKAEVDRMPVPPILIGHSMGGALIQWYLRYIADDLPAVVLAAPWPARSIIKDGLWPLMTFDPLGILLMMLSWDATPLVRKAPKSAARFLVGPRAAVPLDDLKHRLGSESALILYQHNPPFWSPPEAVRTPMLWIAGGNDPLLREPAQQRSAAWYGADYAVAAGARHNVMMADNYVETARQIHAWLQRLGLS